jgi:hypothetical protein
VALEVAANDAYGIEITTKTVMAIVVIEGFIFIPIS